MKTMLATTTLAILWLTSAHADLTITVRDMDTGHAIEADVILHSIGPPPLERTIATTDRQTGIAHDTKAICALGDVVAIKSEDDSYDSPSRTWPCDGKNALAIVLRNKSNTIKIMKLGEQYEAANQYGRAGQAYSEVNWFNPSDTTEMKIYANSAAALDLNPDRAIQFDEEQGKAVPTPVFVETVRQFQREKGLNPTGTLNAETMRSLAGGTVSKNVLQRIR